MHVAATLEPLQISIPNIKHHIERFVSLGIPSTFPLDGCILGVEQVLGHIEHLQQDRSFIQHLTNPILAEEVERLLHPLVQLYVNLKLVHDELGSLPFNEIICLD